MRRIATFLCYVGVITTAGVGPTSQPASRPADTQPAVLTKAKAVQAFDEAVSKASDEYFAAVRAANNRCVKQLEQVMSEATRRGDLDTAIAARDEMNRRKAIEPAKPAEAVKPTKPAETAELSGSWDVRWIDSGPVRVIFSGATIEVPAMKLRRTMKRHGAGWSISWPNGNVDRFTAAGDRLLCEQWANTPTTDPPTRFGLAIRAKT